MVVNVLNIGTCDATSCQKAFRMIPMGFQKGKSMATRAHSSFCTANEAFGYASVRARAKEGSMGHSLRSRPITDIAPLVDAFTIKV